MIKDTSIRQFVSRWTGHGDEKQETQKFWFELLQAMGHENPSELLQFEKRVKLDGSTRFIDVYIPQTRVIVEQKSLSIDLSRPEQQSGGDLLTPYNQARRYDNNLPVGEKARWIVCCNFASFEIHDMEKPLDAPEVVLLEDLAKEIGRFSFLTDIRVQEVRREEEISFNAGRLVGELYDMILPQYADPTNPETLKSLNQLCVRLVFCLYAEDTGLFGEKDKFYMYLREYNPGQFRKALIELFKVFDTPKEERDRYMDPQLAEFPYIKGGIFTDDIEIPLFTEQIIDVLLNKASLEVDWSDISPTVFGAVFESTLNPMTRRSGGMHYTSVENIHKVIDPLFLDDLREEFTRAEAITAKGRREKALLDFQNKLSGLKFLDPACGSGNFLTETYISLRRLENNVLKALGNDGAMYLGGDFSPIKVKIDQFYGIEINDFAVSVARTALWIAESQTMKETETIVQRAIEYFPLRENPNIVEGNALRLDWNTVVPKEELNYIMGNPPFVGLSLRDASQQDDMAFVFKNDPRAGRLDYVTAWYKLAADYMYSTDIMCCFVSTNSITQGEQVPVFSQSILNGGLSICFAYRPFVWNSEALDKAAVHCVIICISYREEFDRRLFSPQTGWTRAKHINGYLVDAPDVILEGRGAPREGLPKFTQGNKPWDGGFLLLTEEERNELVARYPGTQGFIKRFVGSREFLNAIPRYCLWLKDVSPSEYRGIPEIMARLKGVSDTRKATKTESVRRQADTPMLFSQIRQPESMYILIPETSSSQRRYIPMGFMSPDVIASNSTLTGQHASLDVFGIITSSVHMAWTRTVCGRMKSDYRYSPSVFNNFPWPSLTQEQKARIERTAQAILDARSLYPDCSLADLYDELTMPVELRKAHQANDRAVMEAYGFKPGMTEDQVVAGLLKMYLIQEK